MSLEKVNHNSSVVSSSEYDRSVNTLILEFKTGKRYQYEGVTPEDWESYRNSESTGRGFNEFISKYQGTRIEE